MLTACGQAEKTEAASSADPVTAVTSAETSKAKTGSASKPIAPLSASKQKSYYQSEDFSVTGELIYLQSSLYYPDIVAQMGANPDMFVIEMTVRVKNISGEEKSFDCSKLALLSDGDELYMFDTKAEEAENIKSGKTVTLHLRALCSLSQAKSVSGMTYCKESFDAGEEFIPESFAEIIDIQSADDVSSHLYKEYLFRTAEDCYMFPESEPAAIGAHILGRVGENSEYFAIEYSVTNRSDYALIIDPKKYILAVLYENAEESDLPELMYISANEELMYEPKEEGSIKGIGSIYDIPEFICMDPDRCTEFTILYKTDTNRHIIRWVMQCILHDEPYYAQYESVLANECYY